MFFRHALFFIVFAALINACGVKAPPLPPEGGTAEDPDLILEQTHEDYNIAIPEGYKTVEQRRLLRLKEEKERKERELLREQQKKSKQKTMTPAKSSKDYEDSEDSEDSDDSDDSGDE